MVLAHERDLQVRTGWKKEMSKALEDLAGRMKNAFQVMAGKQPGLTDTRAEPARTQEELAQAMREQAEAGKETRE